MDGLVLVLVLVLLLLLFDEALVLLLPMNGG
jgi:hypothetical protein